MTTGRHEPADLPSTAAPSSESRVDTVSTAIETCRQRGAVITPLREAVIKALCQAQRAVGAYELREQLSRQLRREISAASIYRTLDFLCDHGVAARIESRNAYVACTHPGEDHACVLFVCNDCGASSEVENKTLERLLAADAEALGFAVDQRVVELSGSCASCRDAEE